MGRVASPEVPPAAVSRQIDLLAAARLCTALGRVETAVDVQPLLRDAAAILDATGLPVWVWHPLEQELRPALVHGYPEHVAAKLPRVKRDDREPDGGGLPIKADAGGDRDGSRQRRPGAAVTDAGVVRGGPHPRARAGTRGHRERACGRDVFCRDARAARRGPAPSAD